ncbi:FK506-binding protein 5-like [Phycodurus eques]|uniref:FK506-binding protein 5-like n=1 Tax=Phycodurus eques TaxID=693459 RepID=UPI002ACE2637|nr:FK506-binding protein 5-like [Phycodurus eques]
MRQLIALWDAEERSTSHSYIDESSYGVVTQQKIKQYLRDFFSERLTSAEHPRDFHDGADPGRDSYAEMAKEEDAGSSLSSPIIGKAMTMISHVIQPVVDTIDSASRVTKTVANMLGWNDGDDRATTTADQSDEGAQQKSAQQVSGLLPSPEETVAEGSSASSAAVGMEKTITRDKTDKEHPVQTSSLSPAMDEAVEVSSSASSSPANTLRSARKDDNRVPPAMFDEAVMEELCNLQYEMQLTPRLSPILEETGETNSSASSSVILEKMCFFEADSISGLVVASEATAAPTSTCTLEKTKAIPSKVPPQPYIFEEEEAEQRFTTEMALTPRVSPFSGQKPNVMGDSTDEKMSRSEFSDEEVTKASSTIEARSTPRLLHTLDGVSPVPSPVTSSPIIEKAKNIISQVMQPVVDTIDSASKVTKTAGKSIAKKVRSMWKYRSGRKKGKRGKGKSDKKAERTARQDILDKEDDGNEEEGVEEDRVEDEENEEEEEEEEEEDTNTAEVDSISQLSGALDDAEVVCCSEVPAGIVEDNHVEKSADCLG